MKILLLFLAFHLLNSFQSVFFTNGPLRNVGYPELTLLTVILSALYMKKEEAILIAVMAGVVRELFSTTVIGPYLMVFLILSLVTCTIRENVFRDHVLTVLLITAGLTFVASVFIAMIDYQFSTPPSFAWREAFMIGLFTAACALPLRRFFLPKRKMT